MHLGDRLRTRQGFKSLGRFENLHSSPRSFSPGNKFLDQLFSATRQPPGKYFASNIPTRPVAPTRRRNRRRKGKRNKWRSARNSQNTFCSGIRGARCQNQPKIIGSLEPVRPFAKYCTARSGRNLAIRMHCKVLRELPLAIRMHATIRRELNSAIPMQS